ncbi:hypothetical protein BJ138DRAFT_1105995 [Hygrophoropsis aurantiaca]|uniref:Uncharacterized protein n=1 Tax=Hygrophoropsis aurantiaca TaxID=72124 RepID=A0ACB7ZWK1_9AGAM|nr:hypothetical protein BJ138DRAFT_1105995 [Hygrophoropsis aurantiaca]
MSIPRPTKSKTVRSVPASTPASSNTVFGRIGARFRSDKHAAEAIEMHPPPPKLPKYSPVGRVALAEADARLYVDKSKDKKQRDRDDESAQPDWVDVEVNCWDIFRAAITSCCSSRRDSQSDDE